MTALTGRLRVGRKPGAAECPDRCCCGCNNSNSALYAVARCAFTGHLPFHQVSLLLNRASPSTLLPGNSSKVGQLTECSTLGKRPCRQGDVGCQGRLTGKGDLRPENFDRSTERDDTISRRRTGSERTLPGRSPVRSPQATDRLTRPDAADRSNRIPASRARLKAGSIDPGPCTVAPFRLSAPPTSMSVQPSNRTTLLRRW